VATFDQALVHAEVQASKAPQLRRLPLFVIEAILIENALHDGAEQRPDVHRSA
jgi:hypothetical protein